MPTQRGLRPATIAYRVPIKQGAPSPGSIVMGTGPKVRQAYVVLDARRIRRMAPDPGNETWRLFVERIPAAEGRQAIDAGATWWHIFWDKRERRR